MKTIKIGDRVERTGSEKDYTTGRQGEVVQIANIDERAQVRWDHSPEYENGDGGKAIRTGATKPMKPIRTWVHFRYLKLLNS